MNVPEHSPWLFHWFSWYVRRYLRRHFAAVRLAAGTWPQLSPREPVVVYLNHPSWWDPLIGVLAADELWPQRRHAAPMEDAALQKYRLFGRLGFFGIQPGRRGAVAFVRTSRAVLDEGGVLWITAQGRFSDARERPLRLQPGLAHLARRMERGAIVPLAIEYPFWTERSPEALMRFGEPLRPAVERHSVADWHSLLEQRLEQTLDELAQASLQRDERLFQTLIDGRAGVGGVYDLGRRMIALWRGERFEARHARRQPI